MTVSMHLRPLQNKNLLQTLRTDIGRLETFVPERSKALKRIGPEKKIPAVFSPNIGNFFVFFSGNFLIFQEISEIFQATSWKNSSRY
jgi:hypothetical protein